MDEIIFLMNASDEDKTMFGYAIIFAIICFTLFVLFTCFVNVVGRYLEKQDPKSVENNEETVVSNTNSEPEGVFYKIYCDNPNGWQVGFALSFDQIDPNIAPQNAKAKTHPNTIQIITDTTELLFLSTKRIR